MAGLEVGVWSTKEEAASAWALDREFGPRDRDTAEERYGWWRRAVERALGWERPGNESR
jgi:glycerol kinase